MAAKKDCVSGRTQSGRRLITGEAWLFCRFQHLPGLAEVGKIEDEVDDRKNGRNGSRNGNNGAQSAPHLEERAEQIADNGDNIENQNDGQHCPALLKHILTFERLGEIHNALDNKERGGKWENRLAGGEEFGNDRVIRAEIEGISHRKNKAQKDQDESVRECKLRILIIWMWRKDVRMQNVSKVTVGDNWNR